MSDQPKDPTKWQLEVEDRLGILPNFFRLAPDAPQITENLWGFAKFGYLDNPLPSLFKERLFVYLSQFCEARYCISRHVGFLLGLGKPSGDRECPAESIEQIVRLLQRPFPVGGELEPHIRLCENRESPLAELPATDSSVEEAIFSCATHVFLQTPEASRCLTALREVLDHNTLQHLLVFLTFVRTAHFWTKVHPELKLESDITQLLDVHEALAECVLRDPVAANVEPTQVLLNELTELRSEREQAELLRVTLASIGDAVIATDSKGSITLLNAVAEELSGWTSQDAIGIPLETVFRIVNETTRQPVENPALRALREGRVVGLANHTILIAKDGTERPIDDSAAPILDAEDKLVGSVLIFRDITERRKAERQVQDALQYAESIVNTVREPMLVLNGELRVQSANRSFYESFAVSPETTQRRLLHELGNGQWNIPTLLSLLENVIRTNAIVHDFEVELEHPGIGYRTMLLNARKFRRENHTELILLAMDDITERKQVQKSERLLASVVESSNDAIVSKSLDGIIQSWNVAAERIFGYTSKQAIGRHISFLIPEGRANEEEQIIESIRQGERVEHFETVRLRSDGRELEVSLTISPIKDSSGQVIGASKIARDITGRKRSEAALRDSEQRYRTLFESMDEGFCVIEVLFDTSGHPIDYIFHETNQMFEQQSGLRDVTGKRMRELVPEHDPHWFEIYGRVVTTGESIRFSNEAKQLGRWFDVYAVPVGSADGRKVAVLFNDITARKQTDIERERLLKEVESERERLNGLFQHAPSFMCVLSGPDHVVERANDRYYQLVGHRDLVGKSIREALPEIRGQGFIELLDDVYRSGEPFLGTNVPVLLQRSPQDLSEERFVDFVYQALRSPSGSVTGILVQGVDLTDRNRAEAALRENEQRFRMLVEQVKDYAIFMTDTEGRATSWNEGVLRVLGFKEQEFLKQDIASSIFTPEDQELGVPQSELDEAAATGSASNDRWMIRRNGTRFWATGVTTGLHDNSGKLLGFMKVMRDQTERKQLEEELRQYAADVSEADRRKTEFLATLGHELRNPLAPIRTGIEILKTVKDDAETIQDVLSTMERQVQQMVRLIDDLLDISRITQGKMVLRTCRVDLSEVIRSAVEAARPFIDEANHKLTSRLPAQPIYLLADPNRLAQVLSNLLNNSAKYTPDGGRIDLICDREDGEAVVTVRDNGLGIPADMLDKIFEMFTQIERPLEEGYTGLGIGLTLVKRLVEMHGGSVEVLSGGAGKGSEFSVRLPIQVGVVGNEVLQGNPTVTPKLRILVVDDNKDAAAMLKMIVKMLGNEVRTAHDGQQAIEIAADFLPDVVLMDLGMPRMDGYEAASNLRKQAWGKQMLLVALTGWGQDEDRDRTSKAGFDHHLVKPAEPEVLRQLLANYQANKR